MAETGITTRGHHARVSGVCRDVSSRQLSTSLYNGIGSYSGPVRLFNICVNCHPVGFVVWLLSKHEKIGESTEIRLCGSAVNKNNGRRGTENQ
jgi:hypothetical protein